MLHIYLVIHFQFHFIKEKTETQRDSVTCQWTHCPSVVEPEFGPCFVLGKAFSSASEREARDWGKFKLIIESKSTEPSLYERGVKLR